MHREFFYGYMKERVLFKKIWEKGMNIYHFVTLLIFRVRLNLNRWGSEVMNDTERFFLLLVCQKRSNITLQDFTIKLL